MTETLSDPEQPHVLLVGTPIGIRRRLGIVFKQLGVECEAVFTANAAVERITEGEPNITGVVIEPMEGQYPRVVQAAISSGAAVVLTPNSSMFKGRELEFPLPIYPLRSLQGRSRTRGNRMNDLISDLLFNGQ